MKGNKQKYKEIKVILNEEIDLHRFGTLSISTVEFKRELNEEIEQWNNMIVQAIYQRFRKQMEEILVTQQDFTKKLSRKIENLEDIRIIMETQKTMREIEIGFEMDIEMVENAFALITKFGFQATKEDNDMVKNLNLTWQELRIKAMKTQEVLLNVQAHFQRELIKDLGLFQTKVEDFVVDYNKNGPMQDGLQPKEASDILLMFQNTFDTLWSEHAGYTVGEELFGLDQTASWGSSTIPGAQVAVCNALIVPMSQLSGSHAPKRGSSGGNHRLSQSNRSSFFHVKVLHYWIPILSMDSTSGTNKPRHSISWWKWYLCLWLYQKLAGC